jgi:predicted RNA-binding protein with PUA-like domain
LVNVVEQPAHLCDRKPTEDVIVPSWLFKQEPEQYSYADLVRDGRTVWDGVGNALARQHLRQTRPGDRVLFYATGKVKAIVGEMRIVEGPKQAPEDGDAKAVVVVVEPVRALARPVPLVVIKDDPTLADWDLVRLPRLSVMPVTEAQYERIEALSRMDS